MTPGLKQILIKELGPDQFRIEAVRRDPAGAIGVDGKVENVPDWLRAGKEISGDDLHCAEGMGYETVFQGGFDTRRKD